MRQTGVLVVLVPGPTFDALVTQSGKLRRSNISTPYELTQANSTVTAIIFIPNPAFAISLTLRCPPEKTMALGGVATGNMKANEQEMAAGSIIYQGWTRSSSAREAKIGKKMVAVAVLDVTSVNAVIITQTIITIA